MPSFLFIILIMEDNISKVTKPTYFDKYNQYSNTFYATNVKLNATLHIQRRKAIESYNAYSRYIAKQHLKEFKNGKSLKC